MEKAGLLTSPGRTPAAPRADPRRRFYRVTLHGEGALADALERPDRANLRRSAAAVRT